MTTLALKNLSAGYSGKTVVKDINLEFSSGELTGILGLNGSGKTTLLKTICNIIKPQGGSVYINSADCHSLSRKNMARLVSLIPQRHSPQIGTEVLDVILMGRNPYLKMLEFPSEKDRKKGAEIAQQLGIGDKLADDFEALSEGQKQLVILARTLLQDTNVLLMDEPDSALDYKNKHNMLSKVKDLVTDEGKVGIITTHDPNFAFRYCHRLILLEGGQVAGDFAVKESSKELITQGIQKLYGEISLIFHQGYFLMLQK